MKKAIFWVFIFLISLSIVYSQNLPVVMQVLGTNENDNNVQAIAQNGPDAFAVNFTASHNYTIEIVSFFISERVSDPANFNVSIFNDTVGTSVNNPNKRMNMSNSSTRSNFDAFLTQGKWYNASNITTKVNSSQVYWIVFHGANNSVSSGYYRLGDTSGTGGAKNCVMTVSAGNPETDCGSWASVPVQTVTIVLYGKNITPLRITAYSDQGSSCSNWNTNQSNPCSTSDTTPTLYFNTSEPAFCAIGLNNSNYTTMGSSRNCTVGEGTTEHACDLTPQDELVYEDSTVYLSCKDESGNFNRTSTSGALKLSITGLETARRNSIGIGIQNALLSGYTNYTDLQIYARNLSNAQVKGTFDRAAKKSSKMWAFNGIGISDSHVNMFNLTPVLYTFEFANKTSVYIENQTALLINATK